MDFVAIIPARGGSKGLVNKNLLPLNGKPLIVWTIEQALSVSRIRRVIVSTDSQAIADIALKAGAEVPGLRPNELAEDHSPTEPVLLHAVTEWCATDQPEVVILLQPTSPLRLDGTLEAAMTEFERCNADSLLSVCENHSFFWKAKKQPCANYDIYNRPRRQDIQPDDLQYRETGSFYLTRTEILLELGNRLGGKIELFTTPEIESWEIDTEIDFLIVEKLMQEAP